MVRSRLLVGCALAVIATSLRPDTANAQAFAGTPTTQFGSVTYNRGTPGVETLVQDTSTAVIDWVPTDTTTGPGTIDFLPSGNTATFVGAAGPDFTVLNRIFPGGTAVGRTIGFNGTVESGYIDASSNFVNGGSVWFYSPGGIFVGSTGVFDVGSLVLTANDVAVDGNGSFIDPSGNSVLTAAPGSRATVQISPGAQVNALVPGSYVALIAPRVIQSGTVNIDGAAAYVAAEATTINVNAGLFDITLTTGSVVDPAVPGDGATLLHNGVTNLGTSGGQHIYMAALPKNDAVTILVSGTVGYDPASVATVVGDTVVLSAGADIVGGTIATSFKTATPASIALDTGVYGPAVTARAVDSVNASGTMAFGGDASLFGGKRAMLNAKSGETITVGGTLVLASQSADTGGTLRGGIAEIVADAGSMVTIGGSAVIDAGAYLIPLNGRPFPPSLSGIGNGPNAIGGAASIQANAAIISVGGTTFIGADAGGGDGGIGANGGAATAGSATLSLIGSRFSGGGDIAVVARGLGGIGVAAGNATGGTSSLSSNGSLIIGNGALKLAATGTGGGAFDGGAAGVGRGGQATAVVNDLEPATGPTPDGLTVTSFTIEANGVGGTYYCGFFCTPSNGAPGGDGFGGTARLSQATGIIRTGDVFISADGSGGNGVADQSGGNGGNGGSGFGGASEIILTGGTITPAVSSLSITLSAMGDGGSGGFATRALISGPSGDGGRGGDATGGKARADIQTTLSADDISLTSVAFSGSGGNSDDGSGGNGGNALNPAGFNTTELIVSGAGNLAMPNGTVELLSGASASGGGDSGLAGYRSAGGAATGGTAIFTNNATIELLSVSIDTTTQGGGGGFNLLTDLNGTGGNGTGGTSRFDMLGGNATIASMFVHSFGFVGDSGSDAAPGISRGGTAQVALTGGTTSVTDSFEIEATGSGFDGETGTGGDAFGGSATFLAQNGASFNFTGTAMLVRAAGIGSSNFDGPGGSGFGGNASLGVDNGTANVIGDLTVSAEGSTSDSPVLTANGTGGTANIFAMRGGSATFSGATNVLAVGLSGDIATEAIGTGGNAALLAQGGNLTFSGTASVSADGQGWNAAGGVVSLNSSINGGIEGAILATSPSLHANGLDRAGGTGVGGRVTIDANQAPITLNGDVSIEAKGSGNIATSPGVRIAAGSRPFHVTGNLAIDTSGPITILGLTNGAFNIDGSLAVSSAGAIDVSLLNPIVVNQSITGGAARFTATDITINGSLLAPNIRLESSDITINPSALVGDLNTTSIALVSPPSTPMTVGGTGSGTGYRLSNDEFGRLQAQFIFVFALNGLTIEQLDLIGTAGNSSGTRRRNIFSTAGGFGALNFDATEITITGAMSMTGTGIDDRLTLISEDRLDVLTPTGSIAMTGVGGALAGELAMNAKTVFVGSPTAANAIAGLSSATLISTRLGINDGALNTQGYVQAGKIGFAIHDGLYIQNSGGDQTPDDRAGFTAGAGGVSIRLDQPGSPIIAINGRIAGSTGTTTGTSIIPLLTITDGNLTPSTAFDQRSTANGCLIVSGLCPPPTEIIDAIPPVQDIIGLIMDEGSEGLGTVQTLAVPLIELPNFNPLDFAPLIDEPVTGTGNEDLWIIGPGGL